MVTAHALSVVGIGVIGCGQIARSVHLPILTRFPGVRVAGLADLDTKCLIEAGARAPSAERFADYARLLKEADVEAVVVCVPSAFHADVTLAALDADKHVYLEKPLATTADDAIRVREAWRRSGRVGMIGFNYRFNALYQQARQHVASGRIGTVVAVRSVFSTACQWLPEWKRSRATGGGALLDLASHEIDLVRFVLGREVAEVSASVGSRSCEGDSAVLNLRLTDGVLAQVFVAIGTVEEAAFEVYGEHGKVAVNRYQGLAARVTGLKLPGRLQRVWHDMKSLRGLPYFFERLRAPANEPSYAVALAHFADAIRGQYPACPDLDDGYRSLAVVLAAEESARTGRLVVPSCASEALNNGVALEHLR